MKDIISLAKRRGFIYQGSEIYGGLAGTWDYGPLGVALKNNIKNSWWKRFVDNRLDMYGMDAAILMNPSVWKTSGHVDTFTDPLVECTNEKCKKRHRADVLFEDFKKENPGLSFDLSQNLVDAYSGYDILCPNCGTNLRYSTPRQFNMMFATQIGAVEDSSATVYLRPETAQGMFVNFKNVMDSFHPKLPFGMAQIGKAFRNEITPRDFVFRVREFEQMEIEYFVNPADWEKHFQYFHDEMYAWMQEIGIAMDRVHELEVEEADRAHYSKRTIDWEFDFPFGKKELYGLAYRTDYDLRKHGEASGVDMSVREEDGAEPFIPHVIEPSFGLDRTALALLLSAYSVDESKDEARPFLKLPAHIAPVIAAVSPLLRNKPELVEKARVVFGTLKSAFGRVMWDDNGNIGKRYRRQDEIGTPFCIVIDFDSLENDTVTVRDRDTGEQTRVAIAELVSYLTTKQQTL